MSSSTHTVVRSAKTGRFAMTSKARTAPASHVTETIANSHRRPKAKKGR